MRHAILLLDIDFTLVDTNASSAIFNHITCTYDYTIHWTGGSHQAWRDELANLKINCLAQDIFLHVGIATYKPEYTSEYHKERGLKGDYLSAAILEDETYFKIPDFNNIKGLGHGLGLKDIIDPELVYFTNSQSKVKNAMELAVRKIEKRYSVNIAPHEAILIDDQPRTCEVMITNGYNAICVYNLYELTINEQKARINQTFQKIHQVIKLTQPCAASSPKPKHPISPPTLADIQHLTFFSIASSVAAQNAVMNTSSKEEEKEEKFSMKRDPATHKWIVEIDTDTDNNVSSLRP